MSIGQFSPKHRADDSRPPDDPTVLVVLRLLRVHSQMTTDEIRHALGTRAGRDGQDDASRVLAAMRDEGLLKYEQDERGRIWWRRSARGITKAGR